MGGNIMKIDFQKLNYMHDEIRDELNSAIQNVLNEECFIGGEALTKFEENFCTFSAFRRA